MRQNYKAGKPPNQRQDRAADQSLFHQGYLPYSQFCYGSRRWLHSIILNSQRDMITGGKRMKSLLLSGKVNPDMGGQVLDLYNQSVLQGISPTIKTTVDTSNMTFVTIMNKEIIHTAPNGKKYSIQIRKYTPRDCFRLMGVHEADIDKLLSKEKSGQLIICKSKLYALAGNSIVTNCLTAMFEELIFPSGNYYHDKSGQLSLF